MLKYSYIIHLNSLYIEPSACVRDSLCPSFLHSVTLSLADLEDSQVLCLERRGTQTM